MITIGINPVLFNLGPIEVRWYGVFILLAVVTVVWWAIAQVRGKRDIPRDAVFTATIIAIPSGIVFSRLLHVIDSWVYYQQNPGEIFGGAGLAAYGAILGATLGVWGYSRISKFRFGYFADLIAPGIILAQAVGRVGCTINGCCYGLPSSLPWAVVYTNPNSFAPLGIPTHPTTVYEIIWNLAVFAVLFKLRGRLQPEGSLFLLYLSLYSVWRFVGDFLREGTPYLFGLHQAQVIAIIVLAIAVPLLVYRTRWVKQTAGA